MNREQFINFNPRSPCGERPADVDHTLSAHEFQSTLPVRGATDKPKDTTAGTLISIHAPRAGSDCSTM